MHASLGTRNRRAQIRAQTVASAETRIHAPFRTNERNQTSYTNQLSTQVTQTALNIILA